LCIICFSPCVSGFHVYIVWKFFAGYSKNAKIFRPLAASSRNWEVKATEAGSVA